MTSYIEHQQSVLGAIFLESSCIDEISPIVKVSDFDERHGAIYQNCLDVVEAGGIPDIVTISKLDPDSNDYLMELIDFVPTVANVSYYAKGVADFGQRRKIGEILTGGMSKLRDGDNPVEWIEEQLSGLRTGSEDVRHIKKVMSDTWKEIEEIAANGFASGYKIGIPELDKRGMFQDGDFIVIAGRPGMGKSVLGAQLLNDKEPSLIFTYEMSDSQLCKRMIAASAKVNLKTVRSGAFKDSDYPKITASMGEMSIRNVYFCEASKLSIQDIRAKSRIMVRKHGIKKIVLDYMQLCYDPTKSSREQEIASIARNLKLMAKELNVCVVGLSQLNRKLEDRSNKRPVMADLRESGAIEQDADVVLSLYREHIYDQNAPENEAEIIINKFRNGETGWVKCLFVGKHQIFTSEYR